MRHSDHVLDSSLFSREVLRLREVKRFTPRSSVSGRARTQMSSELSGTPSKLLAALRRSGGSRLPETGRRRCLVDFLRRMFPRADPQLRKRHRGGPSPC